MATGVKRSLVIHRRPAGQEDGLETRLFWMNDLQAHSYDKVLQALLKDGVPQARAENVIDQVILAMFRGKMPKEENLGIFHELRLRFPILHPDDFDKLPIAGAPDGWITTVNLSAQSGNGMEVVRFDMSKEQAIAYNDAIGIVSGHGHKRDEAWMMVNQIVGALLCGAPVKDDGGLVEVLSEHFKKMSRGRFRRLPRATEEDVRDWSFRQPDGPAAT